MNKTIYIITGIIFIVIIVPSIFRAIKVYLQRKQEKSSYVKGTNGYNWNKLKEEMLDGKIKCKYCGKKITIKKTTPLSEVEKLFTQNMTNDYFHNNCWDEFQCD